MKNLLRGESPRDYVDIERSLLVRPNVILCDIAHLVARHGNKTVPGFFSPNEGRLHSPDEAIISLAQENKVEFSIPFLTPQMTYSAHQNDNDEVHPVTGSSERILLFDWFHKDNCKEPVESLRKCSLVQELKGIINTQALEQENSSRKRDLYFINNMNPATHLFLVRLLVHVRNCKINKANLEKNSRIFSQLNTNKYGQLCQVWDGHQPTDMQPPSQPAKDHSFRKTVDVNVAADEDTSCQIDDQDPSQSAVFRNGVSNRGQQCWLISALQAMETVCPGNERKITVPCRSPIN